MHPGLSTAMSVFPSADDATDCQLCERKGESEGVGDTEGDEDIEGVEDIVGEEEGGEGCMLLCA